MIVHVRFAPKETVANQNVIRRFVPRSCQDHRHAIGGPALLIGDVEHHVRTRLTAMIFSQPLLLSHLGKRRENWKCQQRG
jgi:hypothetical protein